MDVKALALREPEARQAVALRQIRQTIHPRAHIPMIEMRRESEDRDALIVKRVPIHDLVSFKAYGYHFFPPADALISCLWRYTNFAVLTFEMMRGETAAFSRIGGAILLCA